MSTPSTNSSTTPAPNHPQKGADWIHQIGRGSLVVIDEAGSASTPKLDAVIAFVADRGGRVLLLGDDRQRAAIGAGGLLRDIQSIHGALALHEVLRFTDPVEGSASLALREGDPGAVGYWADHHRIHPVTPDTAADQVFTA
ncbi:MAG: AAA family ATPase [Nakamurella sp.]